MTDMQTDEPKTTKLPNGNTALQLGTEPIDPAYFTIKQLIPLSDERFGKVMAWVNRERNARALRLAESDAAMAERAAVIRAEVEARHKAQQEFAERFPWKVALL